MKPRNRFLELALSAHATGDTATAAIHYRAALRLDPKCGPALGWLGTIEGQAGDFESGEKLLRAAIKREPSSVAFRINYANLLQERGRYSDALKFYEASLKFGRDPTLLSNIGACLIELNEAERALVYLDEAVKSAPMFAAAWNNRGNALLELRRYVDCQTSLESAISLSPDYAEAWSNMALLKIAVGNFDEAISCCDQSLSRDLRFGKAWHCRAIALGRLNRQEDALVAYQNAVELDPTLEPLLADLVHTQMRLCDWRGLEGRLARLLQIVESESAPVSPFPLLGLYDSAEFQRRATERFVTSLNVKEIPLNRTRANTTNRRVRIGYFSADFKEHPVSHLMLELIRHHDREKYEIFGFSLGKSVKDPMRLQMEQAFDRFIDVCNASDDEVVVLARELEVDVAFDLGGHTLDSRPAIFLKRVAPIQVNYLGYPGTWGSRCIDFILGDEVVTDAGNQRGFTEDVARIPGCFQINPAARPRGAQSSCREDLGLPSDQVVYCCFCSSWKITPEVFLSWMAILRRVPNSILWLYADNPKVEMNLRSFAEDNAVERWRLVFSSRVSRERYLEWFHHADLFLDTFPYNAGTTASDSLWMGLPILTRSGETFASRMAASLLMSVGVPELVCGSLSDYEATAVELGNHPTRLKELRGAIEHGRSISRLFDPGKFTANLEIWLGEVISVSGRNAPTDTSGCSRP